MRIILAPDKFKDSLSASDVCRAMEAGIRRARPDAIVESIPMADGGEGTVDALVRATNGRFITRRVTGPLPEMRVDATFGILGDGSHTAVIEMASASGLALLKPSERDPLATTTFGTGELIRIAVEESRVRRIILGIGGSATIDAGIGAAQACGLPVILEGGEPVCITEPLCGRDVERVVLYGPEGAARIFGEQKGATPAAIEQLDAALAQLARRTGHDDLAQIPGAGAAGGLGFGMMAFFGATLRPGASIMIDAVKLRERLAGADSCLTGEGSLDRQSLSGKAPIAVARLCAELGVPCIAIAGRVTLTDQELRDEGLRAYSLASRSKSQEQSMSHAAELIEQAVRDALADR
jgi:glycerate kinase